MSAPLVRVEATPVVEPVPEPVLPPVPDPVVEPVMEAVAEFVVDPAAEPVAEPVAPDPPVEVAGTEDVAEAEGAEARRYCGMCSDRVPIDPDGLRCYLGHRLSPAHAEPRRGLLRRLLRRR